MQHGDPSHLMLNLFAVAILFWVKSVRGVADASKDLCDQSHRVEGSCSCPTREEGLMSVPT